MKNYQGVPGKYVESYLWVKKCVEKGAVVYTPLVYKNPGGRRPGEECVMDSFPEARTWADIIQGELSSRKKTRIISAIGSLPRFLTRRQAVGLVTDCTSNFVIWYVTLRGSMFLVIQSECRQATLSMRGSRATHGSPGVSAIRRIRSAWMQ